MMLRVGAYARYSDSKQSAASIDDQNRMLQERRASEGWGPLRLFQDRAISGESAALRPGYQALINAIRHNELDVVMAESLDRLTRDLGDAAQLHKLCRFYQVQLITLQEGVITPLHVGLKGTMNAIYLDDLAFKTRRGLAGRVVEGASAGGLTYGFDVVPSETDRGQRRTNLAQSVVVRRIFQSYAAGQSPKRIAHGLNVEAVPGPRGRLWSPSTINGNRARGTGILNNELYIGQLVWNRLRYRKDPETGKRRSQPNAPEEVVRTPVPELRIITDELWQAVRERQEQLDNATTKLIPENQRDSGLWTKQRPRFLFSGLLRCGSCGGGFAMISATHLGCSTARNKGESACANRRTIKRQELETRVLDRLTTHLMDPEIYRSFVAGFTAEWNKAQANMTADHDGKRALLAQTTVGVTRLVAAIEAGAAIAPIQARLEELEQRRAALLSELAQAAEPAPRLMPDLADTYRARVASLREALDEPDSDGVRNSIRSLVNYIALTPDADHLTKPLNVEVTGELAAILAIGSSSKKDASATLAAQLKLVAGAGFEPAAFRL